MKATIKKRPVTYFPNPVQGSFHEHSYHRPTFGHNQLAALFFKKMQKFLFFIGITGILKKGNESVTLTWPNLRQTFRKGGSDDDQFHSPTGGHPSWSAILYNSICFRHLSNWMGSQVALIVGRNRSLFRILVFEYSGIFAPFSTLLSDG